MKFIQHYHNEHTKIEFGMLIVVILYELHTLHFAVLYGEIIENVSRIKDHLDILQHSD